MKDEFESIFDAFSIDEETVTIEDRKEFNSIFKKSKQNAKKQTCFYCNNEVSSFCNSHSIPAFALRNIAKEGKLLSINNFIDFPLVEKENGIRKVGTFHIICEKCDNTIFFDYETPDKYDEEPTQKMLSQMALKSYLYIIGKKNLELSLFESYKEKIAFADYFQKSIDTIEMEIKEYIKDYNQTKRSLVKNWNDWHLIYYSNLPYVVPIAFQDRISMFFDLDDNIINDVYNPDSINDIKDIHLGVFPLENTTAIIIFISKKNMVKYRSFYKKFKKTENKEQLEIINYIILAYSENFFISPYINQEVLNDTRLVKTIRKSSQMISETENVDIKELMCKLMKEYSFLNAKNTPNLLSEEHRIR